MGRENSDDYSLWKTINCVLGILGYRVDKTIFNRSTVLFSVSL